jgi:transcriptional regulator with GAF, ATPase, and Fis domain
MMVHARTFREDLWYRINMFPILLPRLSERVEDIPALAKQFAKKAAANLGLPPVELGSADIAQLIEYAWPGNIRELQAVMDRAVILGRGIKIDIASAIGIGQLPRRQPATESLEPTFYEVIPESPSAMVPIPVPDSKDSEVVGRVGPLDEAIKRHIERALVSSNGQIEGRRGAAILLRINPHTLRAKMRKLGIHWDVFRQP